MYLLKVLCKYYEYILLKSAHSFLLTASNSFENRELEGLYVTRSADITLRTHRIISNEILNPESVTINIENNRIAR